jgi:hypothetical protein
MKRVLLLLMTAALSGIHAAEEDAVRAQVRFFETEVRPILANRCFECHGEKKQKGGLRVDAIAFLKAGGDNGPALVPGKPDESPLIEAVRYAKADFQMPPKKQLPPAEVAVLERWVSQGAYWPAHAGKSVALSEGGFTEEQRNFWCFRPLSNPEPPEVPGDWARTAIDRFVACKHRELGFTPAEPADPLEFVRRATMDLHGLPPTAGQIQDFASDTRPGARERFIDGLLESPHYGERWAQHWLDLVRYAESDGYNADEYRANVWPYRDWVIRSLNADKPYDQFVREQLAGDEMAPENPDVLIATSFLRNPVYEWNQVDVRGQWDLILTDITDTTGEVFLGLSVGCARCHNHKFDPILQKDYFRLRAFFAPVQWRDDLKLATPSDLEEHAARKARWEEATAGVRAKIAALVDPLIKKSEAGAFKRFNPELQGMMRKPPGERDPLELQLVNLCERQMSRSRRVVDPMKALKTDEAKAAYQALQAELKQFEPLAPKPLQEAFVATDVGTLAPPTTFKTRKGEQEVLPGVLSLLEPGDARIQAVPGSTGRRTALAEWIVRPDNPLSTRVIVNRVWQYHFGRGLVASSSDFGKLGEPPSHPELLDWLARRFVAQGWSLKKLHKEIMLSAAYGQTARRTPPPEALRLDPANKYLWRFSPRRLDAEQVRDAMLAVSGELVLKAGGPSEDANAVRRSIYTIKKRNNQNELLRSLDAPAGFASTPERQSTTTPTQALLLLNGDWPLARARKIAARIDSIEQAWEVVLGRLPTSGEREVAAAFLAKRWSGGDGPAPVRAGDEAAPGLFREKSEHERLLDRTAVREGDDFSVEAVFRLDSIDAAAAVRTLVSRWSGAKDSIEAYGWSLGVTGEKSRFKPRNLIVQLVGEDENSNIGYEVVASNLRVEPGRRYHATVSVSCADRMVHFTLRELDTPGAPLQTAAVHHALRGKLGLGSSTLVVGGLGKRLPGHQWDGRIEALRLSMGRPQPDAGPANPESWTASPASLRVWNANAGPGADWTWAGEGKAVENTDPRRQAFADLCQVLLNANEFLYLH